MRRKRGGWARACVLFVCGIAAALWVPGASAAAVVADLEGDVRVEDSGAHSRALVPGQHVDSGSVVITATGSRVLLRFDDGQWAALYESTELRIQDFHFQPGEPGADRAAFVLLRGVLRMITGALGHRSPGAFELRTSAMTIGVRGTDFMVAVGSTTYLRVLEGNVVATNAAGRASFGAGEYGAAAEGAKPVAAIVADALPAAVSAAFGSLRARRMAPPEPPGQRGQEVRGEIRRDNGAAAPAEARERARGAGAKGRVK